MKSVYSTVRSGSLNKLVCASSLNGETDVPSVKLHWCLPIIQHSCRFFFFWQSITSSRSLSPTYSPDLAACDFWLFPKLKTSLKGKRFVNATVTQYTSCQRRVTADLLAPQGCTVRSPLTGYQVTSRPRDRFSRYSKWLDTFQTALIYYTQLLYVSDIYTGHLQGNTSLVDVYNIYGNVSKIISTCHRKSLSTVFDTLPYTLYTSNKSVTP